MTKAFSILTLLILFATLLCGAALTGVSETDEDSLRLICLNIGKADCMLLLYRNEAYLIDTGYAQTYPALEACLKQYGVTRLNGVFLTHCHKDHMGGLISLAKSDIQVDNWYAARIYYDVDGTHPMAEAAALRGAEVTWLDAGDTIPVQDGGFTVLGPLTVNTDNENNNSLVMRFSCSQGSILLAGDMKEDEEYELLSAGLLSPCDLLKAGHHGDNNATTKELLREVRPQAAVILTSSQEETDTPAPSTVKRLNAVGCAIYVSQDYSDAVLFTLVGGEISVSDVQWENTPEKAQGILLSLNMEQDALTILNAGTAPLSLSGCALYSSKGDDVLYLPDITLSPGESCVVGSKATEIPYDVLWSQKRVWHQKKRDMAVLYDAFGRALARTDNGLEE